MAVRIELLSRHLPKPVEVRLGAAERTGRVACTDQDAEAAAEAAAAEGGSGGERRCGHGSQRPVAIPVRPRRRAARRPPQEGDLAEFTAVGGASSARRTARKVVLLKAGGGLPRFQGAIASLKEQFGFIRSADGPGEVFFHFSEVPRGTAPDALRPGVEVEFCKTKDARTGKEAATRLTLLPAGTVSWGGAAHALHGTQTSPSTPQPAASASRAERLRLGGVVRRSPACARRPKQQQEQEQEQQQQQQQPQADAAAVQNRGGGGRFARRPRGQPCRQQE